MHKKRAGLLLLLLLAWICPGAAESKAKAKAPMAEKAAAAKAVVSTTAAKPAQTLTRIPSGVLAGKLVKAKSPYLLEGSMIVPAGQVLEIEPGTEIRVGGAYSSVTVFGQILAKGTANAPVRFRSHKEKPNPWDWDRVLFRSRTRSFLQYCVFEHSNFGVYTVNASLTLLNCTFKRNSIHGLYARNAQVAAQGCTFTGGHVAAVMLDENAVLEAENVRVKGNMNGVVVSPLAQLDMKKSVLSKNRVGMAIKKGSRVSFIDTEVTENKTGILTEVEIPKKSLKNVFDNRKNVTLADSETIQKVFKKPAEITTLVFAKREESKPAKKEFSPGFVSMRAPREPFLRVVGNTTFGLKYFRPTDRQHPRDTSMSITTSLSDSGDTLRDTTIGGKTYVQNRYIAGLQPEVQLFSTGRKYGWDVNLLMDAYRNEWLEGTNPAGMRANLVNLRMSSQENDVVLGNFFQSGSEITVSSRKVLGGKYQGKFMDMGRGKRRLEVTALGGETERSLVKGDHNPDVPNDTIGEGFAVRQQMMGMGRVALQALPGMTMGLNLIHSRDLKESIIRKTLGGDDKTSNKPVTGNAFGLDVEYRFWDNKLVARAEANGGYADSLDTLTFEKQKRADDFAWSNAAAGYFGLGAELGNLVAELSGMVVRPKYYTGGNPYLTQDQQTGKAGANMRFSDQVSAGLDYELNIRNASYTMDANESTPSLQNRVSVNTKYRMGKKLPEFTVNYSIYDERYQKSDVASLDIPDTVVDDLGDTTFYPTRDTVGEYQNQIMKNIYGITIKQPIPIWRSSHVRLGYRGQLEQDGSNYLDPKELGKRNGLQHQVSGAVSTRHFRRIVNQFSGKYKLKTEESGNRRTTGREVSERLTLTIIPRRLKLSLDGKYRKEFDSEDLENEDGTTFRQATVTSSIAGGGTVKITISNSVSGNLTVNYDTSYDETEGSRDNYDAIVGGVNVTYVF